MKRLSKIMAGCLQIVNSVSSYFQTSCIILKQKSYSSIICVFSTSYLPWFDVLKVSYSWVVVKAQQSCAPLRTNILVVTLESICWLKGDVIKYIRLLMILLIIKFINIITHNY